MSEKKEWIKVGQAVWVNYAGDIKKGKVLEEGSRPLIEIRCNDIPRKANSNVNMRFKPSMLTKRNG